MALITTLQVKIINKQLKLRRIIKLKLFENIIS